MSIVICIGRPSIDKVASGEPCDVGQGVTLMAADDLFHASPYAEVDRLRTALEMIARDPGGIPGPRVFAHDVLAGNIVLHPAT